MNLILKGVFWVGLYMQVIILPLVVGAIWPGDAQGRLVSIEECKFAVAPSGRG